MSDTRFFLWLWGGVALVIGLAIAHIVASYWLPPELVALVVAGEAIAVGVGLVVAGMKQ